jgi:hypothetical protein
VSLCVFRAPLHRRKFKTSQSDFGEFDIARWLLTDVLFLYLQKLKTKKQRLGFHLPQRSFGNIAGIIAKKWDCQ